MPFLPPEFAPVAPLLILLGLFVLLQLLAHAALTSIIEAARSWHAVPWLTGWIGVPVHELSHAAVARLLGRRIRQVRLFAPDPSTGMLGYVVYEDGQGPAAWLVSLLTGLAPIAGSALALHGLLLGGAWLAHVEPPAAAPAGAWTHHGATALVDASQHAVRITLSLWNKGGWWRAGSVGLWYAAAAIAAHGVPSREDTRGAWKGLMIVALLAGGVWGICRLLHTDITPQLARAAAWTTSFLAPSLTMGALSLIALWLIATLVRHLRS